VYLHACLQSSERIGFLKALVRQVIGKWFLEKGPLSPAVVPQSLKFPSP
jgi:hypothetical protein